MHPKDRMLAKEMEKETKRAEKENYIIRKIWMSPRQQALLAARMKRCPALTDIQFFTSREGRLCVRGFCRVNKGITFKNKEHFEMYCRISNLKGY